MKVNPTHHLLIGLTMIVAAGLSLVLTPRLEFNQGPAISLEAMIPKHFGEWKLDETIASLMINPELEAVASQTYSQTLIRNYINDKGDLIMLSIAYGGENKMMQIHLPEVCYPAQGFQIVSTSEGLIDFSGRQLPVTKLVATHGKRIEPITYWVMIGDSATRGIRGQRFARLKYGLAGKIPSGVLIRVSTISANESQSYRTEEQFVRDMLGAVPMEYRQILIGSNS